jgi:WD40 repeat protein
MRVFISYSRKDKAIADYIGAELERRGADVFIDYQDLLSSQNWIGVLGREIEARDAVVLLLSPNSVESLWVQAEVAWALRNNKPIHPVLLDAQTSMVDFFFLIPLEQIDFTRWNVDGNVSTGVEKLLLSLNLPLEPIADIAQPEIQVTESLAEEPALPPPSFNISDVSDMFTQAAAIMDDDPESALFLFRQVLQIDPNYMDGRAQEFVARQEELLKPDRLRRMQLQAEAEMKIGDWRRAERIAEDMLKVDKSHTKAQRIQDICTENSKCEPIYKHAVSSAEKGNWKAAFNFLRDVYVTCPEYGDPEGLLKDQVILPETARFLHLVGLLDRHGESVRSLAFAPIEQLLASASNDNTIRLWRLGNSREERVLAGHSAAVVSLAFSTDGQLLASSSIDKTIRLWQVASGRQQQVLTENSNVASTLAFSPDGVFLASGSTDARASLWELLTGHEVTVKKVVKSQNSVNSIAFSPDSRFLAVGSGDNLIRMWDTENNRVVVIGAHSGAVNSIAFSPDGQFLASGASDNYVRLWEVASGREVAVLAGHSQSVSSVAFVPGGGLLASASHDKTIRLWDLVSQKELVKLQGHAMYIYSLAISSDGQLIASGSGSGRIRLWGLV